MTLPAASRFLLEQLTLGKQTHVGTGHRAHYTCRVYDGMRLPHAKNIDRFPHR